MQEVDMGVLLDLYLTFVKIGLVNFGGGYAMLPLLERELVDDRHWISKEELLDYFAIGQCTPGIIALNVSTFIGYRKRGILGGISDGSTILIRVSFKPTPSISQLQMALGKDGKVHNLEITGRHDPVIVPRAVVVVEAMTAAAVLDLLMRNMASRVEYLKKIYN